MTQEQANKLSSSLFRQVILMRMLKDENAHFLKSPAPSNIKNALYRGAKAYENIVTDLKIALPLSKNSFEATMKASDEKIFAMNSILEKLAALSEEEVLQLETQFDNLVKVEY